MSTKDFLLRRKSLSKITQKHQTKGGDILIKSYEFHQSQSLIFQIDSYLKKETKDMMKELRMQVVDNPNFTLKYTGFKLHNLNLKQILGLAYGSWILPLELSIMLRLDLLEYIKRLSLDDRFIVETILDSKSAAEGWLLDTNLWHTRDFFGNILPQWAKTLNRLSFRPVSKKLKRPQRKRGYHDHGTLAPSHTWLPKSDWSLTEEQNEIEEKRTIFQDTLNFLKGWFE